MPITAERIEWNPTSDTWLPGGVLRAEHQHGYEHLLVQLDEGDRTWVQRRHTRPESGFRKDEVCPSCGGSGKSGPLRCPQCNGDGKA